MTAARHRLDAIDIRILATLSREGRLTNAALAERVGLSPSPCLTRVRRLEAAGYITGYAAQIDLSLLAGAITVFTEITLSDHRRPDFARFESGIEAVEEVVECHLVSGGYDYLVKFVCASVADYQATIERVLEAGLGVEKYFSYIVIKSPITGRAPALARLVSGQG